jgi:hypothetical protein
MLTGSFAAVLLAFASQTQAQPQPPGGGLQQCASIEAPSTRLACYDAAIPPRFKAHTSSAPATATPSTPVRPSKETEAEAAFGLVKSRDAPETQTIVSMTLPDFSRWGPNDLIRLQNGQVWQVVDGSRGALRKTPAEVTIHKGLFGAFFMTFGEKTRSPKVRRVQ